MENLMKKVREIRKQKNETKKLVDGKLQNVVEHQNGKYVKIGECNSFYVYQNIAFGSVETIDKKWKLFPSNEGFGSKPFDHCFANLERARVTFPTIDSILFTDYKNRLKEII